MLLELQFLTVAMLLNILHRLQLCRMHAGNTENNCWSCLCTDYAINLALVYSTHLDRMQYSCSDLKAANAWSPAQFKRPATFFNVFHCSLALGHFALCRAQTVKMIYIKSGAQFWQSVPPGISQRLNIFQK